MARTSDFVRPDDVLDPDRHPAPPDKVDYDGAGWTKRGTAVTLICIVGVLTLAAMQPHARRHNPAGSHPATQAAIHADLR